MKKRKNLVFLFIFLLITASISFIYFYRLQQYNRLPRVALVIDDWGYNLNNINLLRSIDIPLTLAVLPNLKYSEEISKEDKFKNREIILHMPMEPKERYRLEKDTITTAMNEKKIVPIFLKALSSVSSARGVSNHMGSKFTADREKMNIVLSELKKKRFFFLDSVSCEDSVCSDVAFKNKVRYIKRDVYLDNLNNASYIKRQFSQLIETAKVRGYAVGTGHDRIKTLEAIKELAPALKNKVRFVFASRLAK